jgi:hypothetical protein
MESMRANRHAGKKVWVCVDDTTGDVEVDGILIDIEDCLESDGDVS